MITSCENSGIQECKAFEKKCPEGEYIVGYQASFIDNLGSGGLVTDINSITCYNQRNDTTSVINFNNDDPNNSPDLKTITAPNSVCPRSNDLRPLVYRFYSGSPLGQTDFDNLNGLQGMTSGCDIVGTESFTDVNPNPVINTDNGYNILSGAGTTRQFVSGFRGIFGIPNQNLSPNSQGGHNMIFPNTKGIIAMESIFTTPDTVTPPSNPLPVNPIVIPPNNNDDNTTRNLFLIIGTIVLVILISLIVLLFIGF